VHTEHTERTEPDVQYAARDKGWPDLLKSWTRYSGRPKGVLDAVLRATAGSPGRRPEAVQLQHESPRLAGGQPGTPPVTTR